MESEIQERSSDELGRSVSQRQGEQASYPIGLDNRGRVTNELGSPAIEESSCIPNPTNVPERGVSTEIPQIGVQTRQVNDNMSLSGQAHGQTSVRPANSSGPVGHVSALSEAWTVSEDDFNAASEETTATLSRMSLMIEGISRGLIASHAKEAEARSLKDQHVKLQEQLAACNLAKEALKLENAAIHVMLKATKQAHAETVGGDHHTGSSIDFNMLKIAIADDFKREIQALSTKLVSERAQNESLRLRVVEMQSKFDELKARSEAQLNKIDTMAQAIVRSTCYDFWNFIGERYHISGDPRPLITAFVDKNDDSMCNFESFAILNTPPLKPFVCEPAALVIPASTAPVDGEAANIIDLVDEEEEKTMANHSADENVPSKFRSPESLDRAKRSADSFPVTLSMKKSKKMGEWPPSELRSAYVKILSKKSWERFVGLPFFLPDDFQGEEVAAASKAFFLTRASYCGADFFTFLDMAVR
ncbi:hypothetical protein AC1031_007855 [Aphanomyces cochlioides]|nr:hypothetical protein AC1031_007855 [Aphanomyces cochlioides]